MRNLLWNNNLRGVDLSLLILRIAGGGLMLVRHGLPKLQKILNGDFKFADPIGLGSEVSLVLTTFAEFACALLIVIGFKSRLASIPLIIAMAVAAFVQHGSDPFSKKELPLIYLAIYIIVFLSGSGKYSIDKK